jgi:hypothetical protein
MKTRGALARSQSQRIPERYHRSHAKDESIGHSLGRSGRMQPVTTQGSKNA